jgi:hypothetical protein
LLEEDLCVLEGIEKSVTYRFEVVLPQFDNWETKLMAVLDPLRTTIASVAQDLANEIQQIHDKLAMATTQAEIDAVQGDLESLRQGILGIVPDVPTP